METRSDMRNLIDKKALEIADPHFKRKELLQMLLAVLCPTSFISLMIGMPLNFL